MRDTLRLISTVLLTILLLGLIAMIPGYAQDPEGEPLEGTIVEGIPISPPTELHLERLAEELLRDGVLTSPLKDGPQETSPDLSSSLRAGGSCYDFLGGTGQLCNHYAQGHSYPEGDSFTLSINTTPDAYFGLYKWQNGRWNSFPIGSVPGPGGRDFIENVQGPAPGNVVLVAVNLLNGDYGWYWYNVRTSGQTCYADIFGTAVWYDFEKTEGSPGSNGPLGLANVVADTGQSDVTSGAGGYELTRVPSGNRRVTASKCGFFDWAESVDLKCGADTRLDLLLVCQGVLWGVVHDAATNTPLPGVLVTLNVESPSLGRTWHSKATTDSSGLWWMLVPLVGEKDEPGPAGPNAYASWSLTMSKDGYSLYEDKYKDADGDGVIEPTEANYYFAEFMGWNSADVVGSESAGCNETFCNTTANKALVPCLPAIEDKCYDPDGGQDAGCDPVRLISKAYIQGRTFCDAPVTDDVFQWGEEQPNVLVRLYKDNVDPVTLLPGSKGAEDTFLEEQRSDANGYYQFELDLVANGDDYMVVAHPDWGFATNVTADQHIVRNLNICDTTPGP